MKTPIEKIYDGQGNTFHPSPDQVKLHKAGWRVVSRRKNGCMWMIKWASSSGGVFSQGVALEMLRQDQKRKTE